MTPPPWNTPPAERAEFVRWVMAELDRLDAEEAARRIADEDAAVEEATPRNEVVATDPRNANWLLETLDHFRAVAKFNSKLSWKRYQNKLAERGRGAAPETPDEALQSKIALAGRDVDRIRHQVFPLHPDYRKSRHYAPTAEDIAAERHGLKIQQVRTRMKRSPSRRAEKKYI